jgi:hypothetical protein
VAKARTLMVLMGAILMVLFGKSGLLVIGYELLYVKKLLLER